MATTAASAGKNSRTRQAAVSNDTDLQANTSGKPEHSVDGSKNKRHALWALSAQVEL
jgi:hypothetical protein